MAPPSPAGGWTPTGYQTGVPAAREGWYTAAHLNEPMTRRRRPCRPRGRRERKQGEDRMTRNCLSVIAVVGMAMSSAFAQQQPAGAKDSGYGKPAAAQPAAKGDNKMQPPPGMSEADMQAMMAAATPGPMHAHLQKSVGNWTGKVKMWMAEGAEPQLSDCTTTIS